MAATVITDLCDLDTVIVGGPLWSRMERHAMPGMAKLVSEHHVPGGAHSVAVLGSPLGTAGGCRGRRVPGAEPGVHAAAVGPDALA